MNPKTFLAALLAVTAGFSLHAQSVLGQGNSRTWHFQFQYASTEMLNGPASSGGYVLLDYGAVPGAGPLEYRLDFFEDFDSLEPISSINVPHTRIVNNFPPATLWLPEFLPPSSAWADLDGAMRVTVLSGEMKNLGMSVSFAILASPGYVDIYDAVIVPEPSGFALLTLAGFMFVAVRFRASRG